MIIEQLRNLLFLGILIVILVGISRFYPNNPICPFDFTDKGEYIKDLGSWLDDYYRKNPNTTKENVLKARMDFLLESGCVETNP